MIFMLLSNDSHDKILLWDSLAINAIDNNVVILSILTVVLNDASYIDKNKMIVSYLHQYS